ncbi:hypothetical protein BDZ91DRAFT_148060 [Kalaharituber pfeilii]|nr:hypothetical protein BDZ91DRAFT_148060 [Kalaharituber pfeilii]
MSSPIVETLVVNQRPSQSVAIESSGMHGEEPPNNSASEGLGDSSTPGDNCSIPRAETSQCISTSSISRPESPALLTPSSSCFPSGVSELNMTQSPTPAAKNDVPPSAFPQHRPTDMQVPVEDIYPEGDLILNLRHSEKPSSVTPHKIAAPLVRFRVSSSAFKMMDGALRKLASLHTSETVDLFPPIPEQLWGYRDDLVTASLLLPVLRDVHISAFRILMKLIHSRTKEFFLDTSPFREPSAINLVTATAEVAWGLGSCAQAGEVHSRSRSL